MHLLTGLLAGMHMLSLTFVAPTPEHRCLIKDLDINTSESAYTFNRTILESYIPLKADGELSSCHRYSVPDDTNSEVVSCDGQFVYDKSVYIQSRVYEV